MIDILYIVKIVTITQLTLIAVSIFLIYITRLYTTYKQKQNKKVLDRLHKMFNLSAKKEKKLEPSEIIFCEKYVFCVLSVFGDMEHDEDKKTNIDWLRKELLNNVFMPVGRKYYKAHNWYKRYIATRCFYYGYDASDREYIQQLIKDKISLVSINAGKISAKFKDQFLINTMLDVVSEKRRLQQSVYTDLILDSGIDISSMLVERLEKEVNPYVKMACYKMLAILLPKDHLVSTITRDMSLHIADLDIAILGYIAHSQAIEKDKLILNYSHDQNPNVKAVIAKLLADIHSPQRYSLLEEMLRDKNWWVRVNAANSLKKMGDEGVAILKRQSPEIDKYAYEIAKYVLTQ